MTEQSAGSVAYGISAVYSEMRALRLKVLYLERALLSARVLSESDEVRALVTRTLREIDKPDGEWRTPNARPKPPRDPKPKTLPLGDGKW